MRVKHVHPTLWVGMGIGLLTTFFLLLFALSAFSDRELLQSSGVYLFFKDILGPVAAGFGGALLGAFATYWLQSNVEQRKERIATLGSFNKGMMILSGKYRDLWNIREQVVQPHQDKPLRFILTPRFQEFQANQDSATDVLNEVLIRAGMSETLSTLMVAEKKYIASLATFRERNEMVLPYMRELDSAMSKIKGRVTPSLSDLVDIHSHTRVLRLYDFTERAITDLDESLLHLYKLIARLSEELSPFVQFENLRMLDIKPHYPTPMKPPYFPDIDSLSAALDAAMQEKEAVKPI